MRHGESLANRRGLIVSAPDNALNDYGLTSKGADQVMASALNTRLSANITIITSDYKRARESAEIMSSVLSCSNDVLIDTRMRERDFGAYELSDHSNYETVWQNDVTNPDESINGVETVENVLKRGLATIESLEKTHRNQTILLVGHGDVLQILLSHHQNINPRFHRSLSSIGNADIRSLSKLELASRKPAA